MRIKPKKLQASKKYNQLPLFNLLIGQPETATACGESKRALTSVFFTSPARQWGNGNMYS